MSQHIKELFAFLKEFLEVVLNNSPTLTFPNVLMIIQKMAENDQNLARLFGNII
jgi:hypothetical protein